MSVLASFDVFDTVLVRRVADPTDIFLLVGRRLQESGLMISPAAFRACRMAAERRCRENSLEEDVTLTEIYRELAFALSWGHDMCRTAERLELEVEAELITANPQAERMIEAARSSGKRIVFVSDIYLPADFIRGQLERFGLIRACERCYVSSAHKATKSSWRLFKVVLEE